MNLPVRCLLVAALVLPAQALAQGKPRPRLATPFAKAGGATPTVDQRDCFRHVLHVMFVLEVRAYFLERHGETWNPGAETDRIFSRENLPHSDLYEGVLVSVTVPSRDVRFPVLLRLGDRMQPQVSVLAEGLAQPSAVPDAPRTVDLVIGRDDLVYGLRGE